MSEKINTEEKPFSILKYCIWASVFGYLFGVLIRHLGWLFVPSKATGSKWTCELLYGPLITVGFFWIVGSLLCLPTYLKYKNKNEEIGHNKTDSQDVVPPPEI